MPITDNDLLQVNRAVRNGVIEVNVTWKDGVSGAHNGTFTMQWNSVEEFKEWLEGQGHEELMRTLMLQCYNRQTGALRPTVFDAMAGKSFRVMQRVQQET